MRTSSPNYQKARDIHAGKACGLNYTECNYIRTVLSVQFSHRRGRFMLHTCKDNQKSPRVQAMSPISLTQSCRYSVHRQSGPLAQLQSKVHGHCLEIFGLGVDLHLQPLQLLMQGWLCRTVYDAVIIMSTLVSVLCHCHLYILLISVKSFFYYLL